VRLNERKRDKMNGQYQLKNTIAQTLSIRHTDNK